MGGEGAIMTEHDAVFAGSIPKFYDTLLAPLIFEAYAADLAELVAVSSPDSVLETAAGSGVVTRALAPRLSAGARYVVTDLNLPMLNYAASRQGADRRIEWRQADALDLPFDDASFDVVCCQFGAMFFPDRTVANTEARRTLRPRGRFIFNVWDRIEENVFADEVTNAVATVFPHARRRRASGRDRPSDDGDRQPPRRRPDNRQDSGACYRGDWLVKRWLSHIDTGALRQATRRPAIVPRYSYGLRQWASNNWQH